MNIAKPLKVTINWPCFTGAVKGGQDIILKSHDMKSGGAAAKIHYIYKRDANLGVTLTSEIS